MKPYILFFILLFAFLPFVAYAQSATIAPAVQGAMSRAAEGERIECILLLREQADLSAAAALGTKAEKGNYVFERLQSVALRTQADLLLSLDALEEPQQQERQPFYVVNAVYARLRAADILYLQQTRLDLARILPCLPIQAHFPDARHTTTAAIRNLDTLTWGIDRIQAQALWSLGVAGAGVVIGGQDTGYDWLHPAISDQYRGKQAGGVDHNYHWHDAIHGRHALNEDSLNPCGFNAQQPCDDGSHGTHTMGTMLGKKDPTNKHIGVAPAATWIGCRNMERGWGTPQTYTECFEWFLAPTNLQNANPRPELAPHVINNSWGCPAIEGCDTDNFELMRMAVANLRAAGVVVVVSAGNDGPDCATIANPAAIYGESFTVGATDAADTVIFFSSRGVVEADGSLRIKPNIVAPGVNVLSCTPNGGYSSSSGTSMAGPHVAGLVALLISAEPTLAGNVDRIEELIEKTAVPLISTQICGSISPLALPNPISGYGRVDAMRALTVLRPDLVLESPESVENLRLFPNPARNTTRLVLPFDADEQTIIQIFNPLGQLMQQVQPAPFSRIIDLELGKLPQGAYYLSVQRTGEKKPYSRLFLKREG